MAKELRAVKCDVAQNHQTFDNKPYCSGNTFCLGRPELVEGFYVSEQMFRQAQHDNCEWQCQQKDCSEKKG
ncbi:hypothetical protein ACQKCH_09585 [Nubsella zeaxanthinifaciens]|uniref:hypothetical protein n=1 Tax=Nubsella zeaxanthinifaciens TaxID=392412 RepID=UPI003D021FA5